MKKLIALLMAACMLFAFTACGDKTASNAIQDDGKVMVEEGVLTFGTDAASKPFEYEENGEIVGFNVEMAKLVADSMGLKFKLVKYDNAEKLAKALQKGKIDATICASLPGNNASREMGALFAGKSLIANSPTLIVKAENAFEAATEADVINYISGKKVAVQTGYYALDFVKANTTAEPVEFATVQEMCDALDQGKVDGMVIESSTAKTVEKAYGEAVAKISPVMETCSITVAVRKGNAILLDSIAEVVAELKDSDERNAAFDKYFTDKAVTAPVVEIVEGE